MAKYKLTDIHIRIAQNNNQYMTAILNDISQPSHHDDFISFNNEHIKLLKPYISREKGGTSNSNTQIPDRLSIIEGGYFDYIPSHSICPSQKFAKYASIKDNILIENPLTNDIIIFNKLTIFCQYYKNELGKIEHPYGESPSQKGYNEYKHNCVPYPEGIEKMENYKVIGYNASKDGEPIFRRKPLKSNKNYDDDYDGDWDFESTYYNDNLDMDQQSDDYYKELGIF